MDKLWCVDWVVTAPERRPDSGQEVVEVTRNQTHRLHQSGLRRVGDEGKEQHTVWQVLDPERDDEEIHAGVGIFLGIHVRDCEGESGQKEDAVENEACGEL